MGSNEMVWVQLNLQLISKGSHLQKPMGLLLRATDRVEKSDSAERRTNTLTYYEYSIKMPKCILA